MRSFKYRSAFLLLAAGLLALPAALIAQQGLSHVRVVRLSYVHGTAAILRPGATDWASAMVNTPIQEGFSLSTSSGSFAEVEFENGSTARLGELSKIDFTQLALTPDGDRLNRLSFAQGYATFHFMPEHGDVYAVKVANTTITPHGKSEFRTDFAGNQLRVEVFSGSVDVEGPAGSAKLGKDKVLDFDTQSALAFNIHEGIQKDNWDQWAEARDRQSVLAFNDAAVGRKSPLYGWSDLGTYGEWAFLPGYGYGWAPYVSRGWSPYSLGQWSWYPGFGWTWISAEPWGWLPFHYGLWDFDPSFGWFWMPGTFDYWSPALVTWYAGPGWIGWAPAGSSGGVTAVPTGTVQNGQPVNPTTRIPVPPRRGKPIGSPPIAASRLALLGGTPLPGNVQFPVSRPGAAGLNPAGTAGATRARSTLAPPTVLMGDDPRAERGVLSVHQGFWGRLGHALGSSSEQPLHARLGTTLGGRYPVAQNLGGSAVGASRRSRGSAGGMRANPTWARNAPSGRGGSGPMILPHASARGVSGGGTMTGGGAVPGGAMAGGGWSGSGQSGAMVSSGVTSPAHSSPSVSGGSSHGSGGPTPH